jgi:hypothetical protein
MTVPQFTGEASLYRSSTQYHQIAAPVGVLARGAAIPQQLNWCDYCERYPNRCSPLHNCVCAGCIWLRTPHPHCICI